MRRLPFSTRSALAGTALVGLALSASAQMPRAILEKDFRVETVPAYEGKTRQGDAAAMVVNIQNRGADANGVLIVSSPYGRDSVRYPVALPRGAAKAIPITFPPSGGTELVLQTDRGPLLIQAYPVSESARASVLAVGDAPGSLAFLDTLDPVKATPGSGGATRVVTVAYGKPEALPEAEAGLDRVSIVALLPGSERLNARQIDAIRHYVLRGGHLVLFGGASAPILTDPRLGGLLPYTGLQPGQASVGGVSVSVQRPNAIPGADVTSASGVPVVHRSYGAGRVTLFSADPTDGALARVPNRARIVSAAMEFQRSAQMARIPMERGPEVVPPGQAATVPTGEIDPFALPIPPTMSILYVLGAYFVVVLPVNFLILRAFKRLEWAWFTAPLLALGFAGVLFRNAGSLYRTGLSRSAQTTILAASGGAEGLAMGKAQIFFPNPQRGAITIDGAEAIGTDLFQQTDDYGYSYRDRSNERPLEVYVTDRPSVPSYGSSALEFRDLDFRQTVSLGKGVRVIETKVGGKARVTVVNDSPFTLRDVVVVASGTRSSGAAPTPQAQTSPYAGGNQYGNMMQTTVAYPGLTNGAVIPPGGRAECTKPTQFGGGGLTSASWAKVPFLVASIDDAKVGPQLGSTVVSKTWTRLAVSGEIGGSRR